MGLRRAIWLLLPLGWVAACGGRFEKTVEGDDQPDGGSTSAAGATSSIGGSRAGKAGSSSRAGSSSKAGGSSRGGTTGVAGAASVGGTTGVAGSVGTGASGGVCNCHVDPGCVSPFRAVANADGCCTHCELDLMQCAAGERGYHTYRAQVIQKYQTLGCMSDSDCDLLFDKNECVAGSCGWPLLSSQIMVVTQMLNSYAQANCSFACPSSSAPQCPVIPAAKCVMSRCQ